MDDSEVWSLLDPLFADPLFADPFMDENRFSNTTPILAHYTSMKIVESILANDEIWFSNPLLMNDSEELRFGYIHGAQIAKEGSTSRCVVDWQHPSTQEFRTSFAVHGPLVQ